MIGASLYIIVCSARNRIRSRLRRLREPRYLIGAVVGAAYLYFTVFARMRASRASAARRAARGAQRFPPELVAVTAAAPALAGFGLLVVTLVSWILPIRSGLLEFSEAEVQFLFPAPVSRRQLLIHRMMRSQLGLLFTSVITGLVMPSVEGYTRVRVSIAMWVLLVTGKMYFAGIALARDRLASRHAQVRRVAWLPVAVLAAAVVVVGVALGRAYMRRQPEGVLATLIMASEALTTGAARIVLWPFIAVVQPLFSAWPQPYLTALSLAVLVLLATIAWVLRSHEAFEAAPFEATSQGGDTTGTAKSAYKVGAAGWTLPITGRPETAFAWKAAMQTLRLVDRRAIFRLVLLVAAVTVGAFSAGRGSGLAATVGMFATLGAAFTVLMAPQIVRMDLRHDLRHLEVLKTWPVPSAAVVRGELLFPGCLLTAITWGLIAIALLLSARVFSSFTLGWRLSLGAGAAMLAPALVFAQLTIHNAVALMFPAWVPLGGQRPRGLDAMGQRLIMLAGTWLMLIVMTLPGAIVAGILWFALGRFIGIAALVPGGAACALVIAIEVLLATEALGPMYERLDVLAIERAE